MATLKLKPAPAKTAPRADSADRGSNRESRPSRPPLRGAGSAPAPRPTLAQAQAARAERAQARRPPPSAAPSASVPPARPMQPKPTHNASRQARPLMAAHRQPALPGPAPAPLAVAPPPQLAAASREASEGIRLSKRMSAMGIASRREADEWIPKGWVRVDGRIVDELGARVFPGQQITVDARARFVQAQKVTVLINKPVGYVSGQAEDGYEPAVVLVKPQNQWRDDQSGTRFLQTHLRGLAPAGRLDIDSVGLLVLTQDGRIARQLIGEDSAIEKEYLVRVALAEGRRLAESELALLRHGLELDGDALKPAQVEWVNDDQLRFVLKEGKKRQIRRMCDAVGLQVLGLKRVRIGAVMLGHLPPGQWRYLRGDEAFAPLV